MRKTSRISLSLLCAAMATTLSAGPAWAECQFNPSPKECGGIGPAKIPCACRDTVVADTILDKSDPVMKGNCCPPRALQIRGEPFVPTGPTVDAHALNPPGPGLCTADFGVDGIDIQGSNVTFLRGIIRGCAVGVAVFGDGNTIERVTVDGSPDRGRQGFEVFGDGNTLRSNLCRDNVAEGIRVSGDGNLLERNYCLRNEGDGIAVLGAGNSLVSNLSHRNGGHGIFAPGQNNSNGRNYATQNLTPPQCLIGNSSDTRC